MRSWPRPVAACRPAAWRRCAACARPSPRSPRGPAALLMSRRSRARLAVSGAAVVAASAVPLKHGLGLGNLRGRSGVEAVKTVGRPHWSTAVAIVAATIKASV